jgi:hypothetical protein
MYVTIKTHPYQSLRTFDRCLMRNGITANTILFSVTGGHVQHPAPGHVEVVNNMAV